MAAWLPLVKAALPYVAEIARAAIPAFTSRSAGDKPEELMQKQIAELQAAVTQNAESVRVLGKQLQDTIQAIDTAASAMEQERRRQNRWLALCFVLSLTSLLVLLFVWLGIPR
jgi:sensor c-di-GMP phosphodiesterase-like protein